MCSSHGWCHCWLLIGRTVSRAFGHWPLVPQWHWRPRPLLLLRTAAVAGRAAFSLVPYGAARKSLSAYGGARRLLLSRAAAAAATVSRSSAGGDARSRPHGTGPEGLPKLELCDGGSGMAGMWAAQHLTITSPCAHTQPWCLCARDDLHIRGHNMISPASTDSSANDQPSLIWWLIWWLHAWRRGGVAWCVVAPAAA
jgi:hypothetical protein